jgi:SAM-dependent methyltransferase
MKDNFFQNNRDMWNEWAELHAGSGFYDTGGFIKGRCTLDAIELDEVGDVNGKSLLHLQCHFGMDTLSWARRGAKVTGVDFSDKAIEIARNLSDETGLQADFICSNLYDLPRNLKGEFDIIYTSAGVLCWLPDLREWADVIAQFLKRGGFFYIREEHPVITMLFDDNPDVSKPEIQNSYFHKPEPDIYPTEGSYAGVKTRRIHHSHEWTHGLGDIINSLIAAGLRIEFLHEYPKLFFKAMPYMTQDREGYWRIEGDKIPLLFTLKAGKH